MAASQRQLNCTVTDMKQTGGFAFNQYCFYTVSAFRQLFIIVGQYIAILLTLNIAANAAACRLLLYRLFFQVFFAFKNFQRKKTTVAR